MKAKTFIFGLMATVVCGKLIKVKIEQYRAEKEFDAIMAEYEKESEALAAELAAEVHELKLELQREAAAQGVIW